MTRYAVVSGGFDPIHSGHVRMIQEAAQVVGPVIVLLNSDAWLTRKKGRPFMDYVERSTVVGAIAGVTTVIQADDEDGTVRRTLATLALAFPHQLVFCNGGDRGEGTTPEQELCEEVGVELMWGIGGGKTQSSSWLLAAARGNPH